MSYNAGLHSVSIVMGVYNGSKYIEEQLRSILSQTLAPAEIIISDDGSSDNTLDVVKAVASRSQVPIKILVNPVNLGFGLNFMTAARHATSDLIAFADQDDVWYSKKLEVCAAAFQDASTVLAVHQADLIDVGGRKIGRFNQYITGKKHVSPREGDPWGGFFGFSMMFRRSMLDLVPLSEDRYYLEAIAYRAHDRLIYNLSTVAGRICELDERLVGYRQHDANLYGAPTDTPRPLGSNRIKLSEARVQAARAMIDLVSNAPELRSELPLYDREKALAWWTNILSSQEKRDRLYKSRGRIGGFAHWTTNLLSGTYRGDRVGRGALRAALKDLFSVLVR